MITAVIVLAVANAVMAVALVATLHHGFAEADAWAVERRSLIDRVIAKHSGEVIALDRAGNAHPQGTTERPVAIGL